MSAAVTRRRHSAGMSLLEVMIALVLMSFGLIGMLGLTLTGLKLTGQSNSRSVASIHAAQILDRLRANPTRALAGQYNLALTAPAPAPAVPADMAQVDLAQWRARIVQDLPGGAGSVAVQADRSVRVVIQWTERADQNVEPDVLRFTFEARL